ncbi:MAG: DUF2461 domain-containing protein [Crocinitomicaceae bacterium]|nr:DUF2461 domain-containing protein [Crocinitomicaceae bacterium]
MYFKQDFLNFFMELAPNNHKDWFDINRKRYENSVKEPFKAFVSHLISELSKKDADFSDLEAKDCIFRINRDIRFSKDKQPYKLQVSAIITPGGKKSRGVKGVYFELGPEKMRVYGGIFEIEKEDLMIVREGIAKDLAGFKKAYTDPKFVETFGELIGNKNKIIAKDLKEAAAKEALIFNKQWYFYTEFEPETILSDQLDKIILDCYDAGRPVENFFNKLISK